MDHNQFDDMKGIFNASTTTSTKQRGDAFAQTKGRIFPKHFRSLWVWPILALLVSCQPVIQEWSVRELGPDHFEIQAKDLILGAEMGKMSLQTPAGMLDWGFANAAKVRPEWKGQELEYRELYQNVDFKLYHKGSGFAGYDLILRPGARVEEIWMDLAGDVNEVYIDINGELVQPIAGGALRHSAPISFQDINGERHLVESSFRLEAGKVGFSLGDYDPKHVVVIDPKMYFEEEEFFFGPQDVVNSLECNGGSCPTPFPEVSNIAPGGPDRGRDNNYNVIVGGDVTVTNAGEMEGKVFIGGNLFMNRTQSYNMGYVGLGSGVVPDNNTVWVTVGGNVEVPNFPTARILGPAGGGGIYSGEFRAGGGLQNTPADANGPGASPDPIEFETVNFNSTVDAMTPNNLLSDMASLSSCLGTQVASPASDITISNASETYTITEISEANVYVVDITAPIGPSFGATINFVDFENDGSETIIFNVDYPTSGDAVKIDISTTTINGMPVIVDVPSGSAPSFQLREGILWNIPDASSVLLGSGTGGGTIDGSFFIPGSSVTTTMTSAGLNGRFYAAGDLIHGGNGSEFHAYPFRGSLPCISNNLPYDLALRKTVSTTQTLPYDFDPGETVAFDITVINQGQVDATNITIEDYAPAELTGGAITVTPATTDLGNAVTIGGTGTNADPFTINTLLAGDAVIFTVTYTIAGGASGTLSNFAEITGPDTPTDEDSTPGNNAGGDPNLVDDEIAGFGGDEDDHDIAVVEICPAQTATEICLGGINEETLTAPSGSGETNYQWYIREGMTITQITENANQPFLNINAAILNAAPFSLGLSAGTTYEFYYTYDDAQDCQQSLCCPLDILVVNCFDYGDLPDDGDAQQGAGEYYTLLANDGPRHQIIPNLYIGASVDTEDDGQPDAQAGIGASGGDDDTGGSDDEDGFPVSTTTFIAGESVSFDVPVFNNTGTDDAKLYAWFDWDNDGVLEAGERYEPTSNDFDDSGSPQTASFSFTVPANATVGSDLGVRFRLALLDGEANTPIGLANSGEVEDYVIEVMGGCPIINSITFAPTGPICENDNFTVTVTHEAGIGELEVIYGASGLTVDQIYASSNVLAILIPSSNSSTSTTSGNISIAADGAYTLYARLKQAATANPNYVDGSCEPTVASTTQLTINDVPALANASVCTNFSTTLVVTGGSGSGTFSSGNTGIAMVNSSTGEVTGVDAGTVTITFTDANNCSATATVTVTDCLDFGDLPDDNMVGAYPTNLTNGASEGVGPSHIIDPEIYIGLIVDDEANGAPDANAEGDDNAAGTNITNGSSDDEDGFTSPTFTAGQTASFSVPVANNTGSDAELYVWFDWNNDGTLDNATERYQPTTGTISSSAGAQIANFSFMVPPTATVGSDLGVRFRLSTDAAAADPTGAAPDGEVEDYLIQVQNPSNLSIGNLVFFDRNNDGLFDADGVDNMAGTADDEFGFDGVTVNLYEDTGNDGTPDGAAVATQTTMSGGSYLFTNLTPNNYIVEVIPPAGYNSSTGADAATGTYEDSAPDPDANNDPNNDDNGEENAGVIRSAPVTLTVNGEPTNDGDADNNSNLAVDFGLIGYNLGNVVFYDANNNGERDAGEEGIQGVTLELLDADNSDAAVNEPGTSTAYTVITDVDGEYLFEGIPAGNYKVQIASSEFGSGETLENYLVSSGAAQQDNPESAGGIDEDANGIVPANPADAASNGVVSGTIAIGTGFAEPEDEDPQDPNVPGTGGETFPDGRSNMTLDFGVYQADFGDLPNNGAAAGTDYAVANADNGPSHIIIDDLRIGATVDAELDGQVSSDAMGDDSGSPDDEDGVDFLNVNIQPGNTIRIPATVINNTGGDATFYGFIDWNNNGVFDAGEASTPITVTSTAGSQTLLVEFNVPTDAQGLAIGESIGARFRLSTDSGLGANGAASNGEVEDYLITTIPCPVGNCFEVQIITNN